MSIVDVCSVISLMFVALTFLSQIRNNKKQAATHISTWIGDGEGIKKSCVVSNDNQFPVYNVISFMVPNDYSEKSSLQILRYIQNYNLHFSKDSEDLNSSISEKENMVERTGGNPDLSECRNMYYYEIFSPGSKEYFFEDSHGMGNEHKVPGIFFTDNQNIQWYRDIHGGLRRKKYIRAAVKAAIIFRHV
ncbi:hypothetical protein YK48G_13380 [Lentilactobacillus fungorum]|uniref:Uncharacterized protein n=1 Tax=Lentilactobacillus fungorum TaxID=2201250 RepID=A0ABQ3VZR4_9LACO|nr:hypothetical protein [Lentilactobacillus fungorum]GHP13913.1 hypothetical protein YK48G_13380 [Lentilactobacillus fungorum]